MIPEEIPEQAMTEPENPTTLGNLANDQCRFPKWQPPDTIGFFCGRKIWESSRQSCKEYCMYHVYIATKREKT